MISDGLIQLIDDQSGTASGGGGSSAAWDRRGEDCRNRERKGGREGGRELDVVSQSATQAWSWLHVIWCV